jgi:hypothetical protein
VNSALESTLKNQQLQGLSKLPGSRRILQPIFVFLINFDDFDYYPYMDTNFSATLTLFLNQLQDFKQSANAITLNTYSDEFPGLTF